MGNIFYPGGVYDISIRQTQGIKKSSQGQAAVKCGCLKMTHMHSLRMIVTRSDNGLDGCIRNLIRGTAHREIGFF